MEETITALLANVAGGRRYWVRAPQGTPPPYVVLNRISGTRDYTMQGPSGYVQSRVQVDCYDAERQDDLNSGYAGAKIAARQVVAALSGVRTGSVLGVFLDAERDLTAEDAGTVKHLFRVSLDFNIHHLEGN